MNTDIKSVTVVGTGIIGASWTCLFLAHGLDVVATDIREGAENELELAVERCWPSLPDAVLERKKRGTLSFTADLTAACRGTGFVQENAIERVEEKIDLMRQIDAATSPGVVIASSSSAISVTDMQSACAHPERVVLGHPLNPPHLVPLVEVVGGAGTGETALRSAEHFYQDLGKTTIRLEKEIYGHVANRLQAAIFREAIHILESGVASAEDIDRAVTDGPGLRWALMGPLLTYRLAGGDRGMQGFWDMFTPMQDKLWRELGTPLLDQDLQQRVTAAVERAYDKVPLEGLVRKRDAGLRCILAMRRPERHL
ncbi:3-hydroxyacyl-CoA dehydrogenase NAD-binding domain-containing protein [Chelativorans sp. AA-79]|uniref:3-hydroxyacyl-CoA dehydrogenase NAD-binding domain-containing protein n=1 Tax=Chelativorans sp. AA-79 TaxID=3028735 RepID=UPI0023F69D8E|nr:3-hydroxyacyl-CoA dehydrogenase NAD-binding domain-containing protein [Chelativorans sp. AA-79]WEX10687.1 3-hydroxyacyl-CoA dehydrogenase NAD-binding domain-containing protein [Chelativorans sp. AA-79]